MAKEANEMKFLMVLLSMFFTFAGMAQAEKVALLIDLPGSWQMDVDTLCGMKKRGTLTFNGVDFEVVRSSTGRVEIGGRLQGLICSEKAVKSSFSVGNGGGGGGGGNADKTGGFTENKGQRTNTPPERGDNAGTPAGGTGGASEGQTGAVAGAGEKATANGKERPTQPGNEEGFEADTRTPNGPTQPDS